jgi:hypothetical protein
VRRNDDRRLARDETAPLRFGEVEASREHPREHRFVLMRIGTNRAGRQGCLPDAGNDGLHPERPKCRYCGLRIAEPVVGRRECCLQFRGREPNPLHPRARRFNDELNDIVGRGQHRNDCCEPALVP